MTLRALTSASDAVACESAVSDGCFRATSTTLHRRSSFLFTLRLPAYTGWAFLLTRSGRALCARWSASGIPTLGFLGRLTATWLACLTVNPSFAVVAAEPFVETVVSHYFFFFFLELLPQLAAPTFLHLTNAPDAYALGQTE